MFPSFEDGNRLKALFVSAVSKGMIPWPQDMTPSQFVKRFEWTRKPLCTLMDQQPAAIVDGNRIKYIFVTAARKGIICWPLHMTFSQFVHLFKWSQEPLMTQTKVVTPKIHVETSNGQKSSPNQTITSSLARKIVCKDPFYDLEIGHEAPKIFNCVVRMSKGFEMKLKYTGLDGESVFFDGRPHEKDSFVFPYNMGYIPRTLDEDDGEGIEVLVIMQEPVAAFHYYIRAKAIGVLPMFDPISSVREDKIIAVCADDPEYLDCNDIKDLPPHRFAELCRYSEDYKKELNQNLVIPEFLPATKAYEEIQHSMNLYAEYMVKYFKGDSER